MYYALAILFGVLAIYFAYKGYQHNRRKNRVMFIPCESTGESMLEIRDGKITALQDCQVYSTDDKLKALKKGETYNE